MLNIEPKVKASEHFVIGLRFAIVTNPQNISINNSSPFFIDKLDDNGMMSFIPTLDYYLNNKRHQPYLGLGLGYYLFNNMDVSNRNNGTTDVLEGIVKNQLGFLLRSGIKIGKMRYGFCLLYTSPSPRDGATSRMPSSA